MPRLTNQRCFKGRIRETGFQYMARHVIAQPIASQFPQISQLSISFLGKRYLEHYLNTYFDGPSVVDLQYGQSESHTS